jgi:CheY-like chemotaxis protein
VINGDVVPNSAERSGRSLFDWHASALIVGSFLFCSWVAMQATAYRKVSGHQNTLSGTGPQGPFDTDYPGTILWSQGSYPLGVAGRASGHMSRTEILIIDDSTTFRTFVRNALETDACMTSDSIREACDGVQGLRLALELLPDLIVLDIGLPGLHGIAVARQILRAAPRSRILFLSQDSSPDVVQEALSTGAKGYVVKIDAARELAAAVRAVLLGGSYVSSRLRGVHLRDSSKHLL